MKKIIMILMLAFISLGVAGCATTDYLPVNQVAVLSNVKNELKEGYKDYTNCFSVGAFQAACAKEADSAIKNAKILEVDILACSSASLKESYGTGTIISVFIPVVGLIAGVKAATDFEKNSRKCLADTGWYVVDVSKYKPKQER